MNKTHPLKGLLRYFWYANGGRLVILFLQVIAWGIIFLVSGNAIIHAIFGINAIAGATIALLTAMGSKETLWERFQLTMPVRRRDLAKSQYLSVAVFSLVGIPIFALFTFFSSLLHEGVFFSMEMLFISIAPFLAAPFMLGGLIFPLACIRALDEKGEAFFPLLILLSMAIPQGVAIAGNHWGWPMVLTSAAMIALSLVIFLVGYGVAAKLYATQDF